MKNLQAKETDHGRVTASWGEPLGKIISEVWVIRLGSVLIVMPLSLLYRHPCHCVSLTSSARLAFSAYYFDTQYLLALSHGSKHFRRVESKGFGEIWADYLQISKTLPESNKLCVFSALEWLAGLYRPTARGPWHALTCMRTNFSKDLWQ